jgi:hypothetical protein
MSRTIIVNVVILVPPVRVSTRSSSVVSCDVLGHLHSDASSSKQSLVESADQDAAVVAPLRFRARDQDRLVHGVHQQAEASAPRCCEDAIDDGADFWDPMAEAYPEAHQEVGHECG